MNIHYIQHEKLEDLGCIRLWFLTNNDNITHTHIWENVQFPEPKSLDMLIVLGGSMCANDDVQYDWMVQEKTFIQKCIQNNVTILGICLGSQLLASVLGAKVYQASQKEIGWFPVVANEAFKNHTIFKILPHKFTTLHWHGDTFDLPNNTVNLFSSQLTPNQAFAYNENVFGLQFHLEMTKTEILEMCNTFDEQPTQYIQSKEQILIKTDDIEDNNNLMYQLLDWLKTLKH